MDAVSLGFATIDLCMNAACQVQKHAEREIQERVLGVKGVRLRTQYQNETLRTLRKELDGRMQAH